MRKDFGIYKRTRDKKGYYYYSFYDEDGVRRYRSTGETVKSKAWNVVMEKYKNGTLYDHPYQRTSFGVFAKPFTFHSFRHYFNTRLVAAGVAGETVRAVIGHESAEMTDRYLHLQSKDLDFIRHLSDEITSLCS